jgi:hypothetical protein
MPELEYVHKHNSVDIETPLATDENPKKPVTC